MQLINMYIRILYVLRDVLHMYIVYALPLILDFQFRTFFSHSPISIYYVH